MVKKIFFCFIIGFFSCSTFSFDEKSREKTEWVDLFLNGINASDNLSHVLIVGDSIARGYFADLNYLMRDKAYISRLTSSYSINDPRLKTYLSLVLGDANFKCLFVNNGLHSLSLSENEYKSSIIDLIDFIDGKKEGVKIIWLGTTLKSSDLPFKNFAANRKIGRFNEIAEEVISKYNKQSRYFNFQGLASSASYLKDGIHFNSNAYYLFANNIYDLATQCIN